MREHEAYDLVVDIEEAHGNGAAQAHKLEEGEWVVKCMGVASGWGNRFTCVYVCWEPADWDKIPKQIRALMLEQASRRKV